METLQKMMSQVNFENNTNLNMNRKDDKLCILTY